MFAECFLLINCTRRTREVGGSGKGERNGVGRGGRVFGAEEGESGD